MQISAPETSDATTGATSATGGMGAPPSSTSTPSA